ncbi:MAG: metalloregulator ArsR/SmtB family transcription factor [Gammaproteobacteria bacterium]|nr:metalloregulator ArsR/SmtB family transcription factor [Gammaproteobacteria bacterium]MDH4256368.1 metalloregulator ArsR/SmtB family transcription factor [Gammaproteobacteria bacterium]MDH5311799.1 metalloregulator ArsR/SmtB family transcription factor [Gammaproteobacteria bacterium]
MPSRQLVARELSEVFKVLAHPDRIRLVEELGGGEMDVNTLSQVLDLPGPRVSQHLGLLRLHRIVEERRDGRHHYYHLVQPEIAVWIVSGLNFVEGRIAGIDASAIEAARQLWAVTEAKKTASN